MENVKKRVLGLFAIGFVLAGIAGWIWGLKAAVIVLAGYGIVLEILSVMTRKTDKN